MLHILTVLKKCLKWHLQRDVLGTSSGRRSNHYSENRFLAKFFYIFWCKVYIRYCSAKVREKPNTPYFGSIMVWEVSTKIGSYMYVLLCWLEWPSDLSYDLTLKNCLFRGAKLIEIADVNKYVYSGYDIGFDSLSEFSLTSVDKNVILFGVNKSS